MKRALFATLVLVTTSALSGAVLSSREAEIKGMVFIEGGTFLMGDIFDEGATLAQPVHEVTLSSFYLNKYEVKVAQFSSFVLDTGYVTWAEGAGKGQARLAFSVEDIDARFLGPGAWDIKSKAEWRWSADINWRSPGFAQLPQNPVTCVSWRDAIRFCNWLSKQEGLPPAYDDETGGLIDAVGLFTYDITKAKGYRLPTEAEWEYAARERGRKVRFGNGQDIARPKEINFNPADGAFPYSVKGEGSTGSVPVGSFNPNSLGLYDMSGNVWEWCSDLVALYPDSARRNPYQTEGVKGARLAARGGPWAGDASFSRTYVRMGWFAEDRCNNIGFRIARSQ